MRLHADRRRAKIGIRYQSYHAYEAGITVPTLENFIKLAKLYDVPLDELIAP
ncbi:MAG TPA: helix-turn-helix domain-containing protein [Candidatus Gallimonas intestinigallinarum]|uniref:Helix-turn-helix domain-containing protein n=1 Tax=Candidatus Gallimonas intestinigallinarum TaxID=2838604 RepID=A0A9D2DVQ9_9FIRM|nr:helix-turn-helix domain-containing protein [Candidatus Gallimonas intestinigallinarum]